MIRLSKEQILMLQAKAARLADDMLRWILKHQI